MLNHLHRHSNDNKTQTASPAGSMQGWARTYDMVVAITSLGQEKKLRQATLDLAQIQPGEQVLEVGCGTGTLSLAGKARQARAQVTGIDIAEDMIETAVQKALKAGLAVDFQVGRIESIPFPDGQFDLVLSSLMLHHIHGESARLQGLREVLRVLKPGGRLLIVDMAPPKNRLVLGLAERVFGKGMLARRVDESIPLLKQAGFTAIESGPTESSFLDYLRGIRPQA